MRNYFRDFYTLQFSLSLSPPWCVVCRTILRIISLPAFLYVDYEKVSFFSVFAFLFSLCFFSLAHRWLLSTLSFSYFHFSFKSNNRTHSKSGEPKVRAPNEVIKITRKIRKRLWNERSSKSDVFAQWKVVYWIFADRDHDREGRQPQQRQKERERNGEIMNNNLYDIFFGGSWVSNEHNEKSFGSWLIRDRSLFHLSFLTVFQLPWISKEYLFSYFSFLCNIPGYTWAPRAAKESMTLMFDHAKK